MKLSVLLATQAIAQESAVFDIPHVDYGTSFVKMFLTLILLITLLYLSVWGLKRLLQNKLQRGSGANSIQILEKRMISAKSMLYLLEIEGRKILIAESHLDIRPLETWPIPSSFDMEKSNFDQV